MSVKHRLLVICTVPMVAGLLNAALFPLTIRRAGPGLAQQPGGGAGFVAGAREGGLPALDPAAADIAGEGGLPPSDSETRQPQAVEASTARGPSRLVVRGPARCPLVALTFDAGAGAEGAASILDGLLKHGARSTFYLTGKWTATFPDLARRIVADGHEIANHTDTHPDLTKLPPDQIEAQIRVGALRIAEHSGLHPVSQFRPPYGAYNETVLAVAGRLGYPVTVYWSIDTLDWQQPPAETIAARVLTRAARGDIVLMHLGSRNTGLALDLIIPALRKKGLRPDTVGALLSCDGATSGDSR